MQKKLFSSVMILLAGAYTLSASAQPQGSSSGSVTPTSPPPMSQQQFKSEIDKAVKNNAEDLNSRVQQIQKAGPGSLIQPEPMNDPNTIDDQNPASGQIKPATTPSAPATIKPTAPKSMPVAPAAPAPTDSSSTTPSPSPYTGFGSGKSNDSNGGNNNNSNSKSNSWNMGY